MAWPFSGSWEGRSLNDLPEIIEAICTAINERKEEMITLGAATGSALQFVVPAGTYEYPTAAQISGIVNNETMLSNLVSQIQTGITQTAAGTGGWTWLASNNFSLAFDGGNTQPTLIDGSYTTLRRSTDYRFWENTRRILDYRKYLFGTVAGSLSNAGLGGFVKEEALLSGNDSCTKTFNAQPSGLSSTYTRQTRGTASVGRSITLSPLASFTMDIDLGGDVTSFLIEPDTEHPETGLPEVGFNDELLSVDYDYSGVANLLADSFTDGGFNTYSFAGSISLHVIRDFTGFVSDQ